MFKGFQNIGNKNSLFNGFVKSNFTQSLASIIPLDTFLWFRQDTGITLNNNNISLWNDANEGILNLSQVSAGYQPPLISGSKGQNTVSFSGHKLVFNNAFTINTANFTLFFVLKPTSGYRFCVLGNSSSGGMFQYYPANNGTYFANQGDVNIGFYPNKSIYRMTPANIYINGNYIRGNYISGNCVVDNLGSSNLDGAYNSYYQFDEVILYNRVLSTYECLTVEAYLTKKYSL